MNQDLKDFIDKARQQGRDDETIKSQLVEAGWDVQEVDAGLVGVAPEKLAVPKPPHPAALSHAHDPTQAPISVVENLSPRGFEYSIMFITLWLTAIAAVWILDNFIWSAPAADIKFPVTMLIVSLPVFLIMFRRLKRAEKSDPRLLHDASRRKSVQGTQRLAFVVLLIQTIGTLYAVIYTPVVSDKVRSAVTWIVSLAVFGGIFAYYWKVTPREVSPQ